MSEEPKKEQPIIVVKKGGRHAGHHGGAWKVAYADFVTAMMAFFLVMWIVTQSEPVKEAIQGYFQDPVNYARKYQAQVLAGGAGLLKGGTTGEAPKPPPSPEEQMRKEMEELATRLRQADARVAGPRG